MYFKFTRSSTIAQKKKKGLQVLSYHYL